MDTRTLSISENAARHLARVTVSEPAGTFLRVSVSGGGCSGFQYEFRLDHERQSDDHAFRRDQSEVVIDDTSLDLLAGAEIDYVEDLASAEFRVTNPNAASSCGCGMSFSLA
jgi:iron-sulfur cluster insertion protein